MQQITRGDKRSKEDQLIIMTDIQDLLPNHNDIEIMNTLHLPSSTYYRYKSKIYKEAKKLWNQICIESLEYRALELKKSLDCAVTFGEAKLINLVTISLISNPVVIPIAARV